MTLSASMDDNRSYAVHGVAAVVLLILVLLVYTSNRASKPPAENNVATPTAKP